MAVDKLVEIYDKFHKYDIYVCIIINAYLSIYLPFSCGKFVQIFVLFRIGERFSAKFDFNKYECQK